MFKKMIAVITLGVFTFSAVKAETVNKGKTEVVYDFETEGKVFPQLKLGADPKEFPRRSVQDLQKLIYNEDLVPFSLEVPLLVKTQGKTGKWYIGWIPPKTLLLVRKNINVNQENYEEYEVKYIALCGNPVEGVRVRIYPNEVVREKEKVVEVERQSQPQNINIKVNIQNSPPLPLPQAEEKKKKTNKKIIALVAGGVAAGIVAGVLLPRSKSTGGTTIRPPIVVTR